MKKRGGYGIKKPPLCRGGYIVCIQIINVILHPDAEEWFVV